MKRIIAACAAATLTVLSVAAAPSAQAEAAGNCKFDPTLVATCTGTIDGLENPDRVTRVQLHDPQPGAVAAALALPAVIDLHVYDGDNADVAETAANLHAGMNYLTLRGQAITDITPLASVNRDERQIVWLDLSDTQVRDYSPLGSVPGLRRLNVSTTLDGVLELKRGKPVPVPAPLWIDGRPLHVTAHTPDFIRSPSSSDPLNPVPLTAIGIGQGRIEWDQYRMAPEAMGGRDVLVSNRIYQHAVARDAVDLTRNWKPYLSHASEEIGGSAIIGWRDYEPVAIQWTRDGVDIPGATMDDYKYQTADIGRRLAARVTVGGTEAQQPWYPQQTATVTVPFTVKGTFSRVSVPYLSGRAAVGSTLTANPRAASPAATRFTYRWYRDGSPIAGATGKTHKLTAKDLNRQINVFVNHHRTNYSGSRTASGAVRVQAGTLTLRKAPAITGTKAVGRTLTASPGTWSPAPKSYAYQWYREGKKVTGATGSRYKVQARDIGQRISVKVTARLDGYTPITVHSGPR